ncbi:MAG TPA: hypothetical protein PLH88_00670 [Spirochaetota bacterium]|nr:hypothetical protein [Spirochaetota bacterium]HRS62947.1 hypothetical protein [Spirochaetota bacterium]HRU65807.1 hypothetical protein [Spirochaetota bacterium]
MSNKKFRIFAIIFFVFAFLANGLPKDFIYKDMAIENISRYHEDRIAYQQVEYVIDPEEHQNQDTSLASLLIIKDKRMYLFKDGYDDPKIVEQNRIIKEMENSLLYNVLWEREIDGKPDYLVITDRRTEILKKIVVSDKNENLSEKYTEFYTKMRDSFIQKHVNIFRGLMVNRKDSELKVIRKPIPKKLRDNGPTKYMISATAKTKDGLLYYAEDADGDGVTETFTVELPDGFNWGYQSGPNIIFIYKNKQKNIEAMIGKLTKEAYEGTYEEENIILKQFNQLDKEIPILMDDLIKMDLETERVMKEGTTK